jgi:DegV family protein with EDD domain
MRPANHAVRVITDSAAALNPRDAAAHDVRVVQMTVELDGRTVTDAEAREAVISRSGGGVHTSAPSPGQFLAAITEPPPPAGAVIVTIASGLSASYQSALLAARLSAGSGGPTTEVVDSGSAAGGQALTALAAARAATDGLPAKEVAGAAVEAANGIRLLGLVGSLDALARGGRLPGVAAAAGRLAGVQPLFELRGGRVHALRPAFSRPAALDRIAAAFLGDRHPNGTAEIAVSHAGPAAAAAELAARLTRDMPPAMVTVGGLGAAMLAHAGPGTLGLAWRWRHRPA